MPRHAFILGGTGQIGRAVAKEFLAANWNVTISHRGGHPAPDDLVKRGAQIVTLDRDQPGQLSRILGAGTDALIDTTAYDRDHGGQLISVQKSVGAFVVISSASV
jgi:NAD(P)-dependent dehydrogenase (short-subunit alcohol dehydrogenase family)